MITFVVEGIPEAQARPRFMRFGSRFGVRSPKTGWYHAVRWQAMRNAPSKPLEGPLRLTAEFVFPRLASMPENQVAKWTRPDLDNLMKAVLDACTRAEIWKDDGQVVTSTELKRYAKPGEGTGVIINVGLIQDPAWRP